MVPTTVAYASSEIEVTKTGPAMATDDSDITYSIVVTNHGPDASTMVTLLDRVPVDTTFVSGERLPRPISPVPRLQPVTAARAP